MKKQIKTILLVFLFIFYSVFSPLALAFHSHEHSNCQEHKDEQTCTICIELASRNIFITFNDFDVDIQTSILCENLQILNTFYAPHKTLLQLETKLTE